MLCSIVAMAVLSQEGTPPTPPPPQQQEGVPPAAPQAEPTPRSQALEDLLRRLSQQRDAPSVVSPNPLDPAPTDAEGKPLPPELKLATLTRSSDTVQVALASGGRRELAYWDARLELSVHDEVRQGPKSCTLLDYADGAHYRIDGQAIWRMKTDAVSSPRMLELVELRRMGEFHFGYGELDTVLVLPGGNELAGRGTSVTLRAHDQNAIEIRNSGPEPVVLRSPYLGARLVTLNAGQRTFLPVLVEPSAYVAHLTHVATLFDAARGKLVAEAPAQVTLTPQADSIALSGTGTITGIARVCGARMVVKSGETLTLTRVPIGTPRKQEWDE